ncbi:MAG: PAS domain S-box protein, partial [Candidatus Omnitrophica bacterium]|nr:PAS domain S-box protein [Candidatus Omnitrophota bacterium]
MEDADRTKDQLLNELEIYHAIFDSANDAIFIHDIENGRIVNVNEKACHMYCYPKDEMLGLGINELSAGEEPYTIEHSRKLVEKAVEGEPQLFEWLAKDKVGRFFWVEISLKQAVIGGRSRLLAIVRDVSERKQTEERLTRINEVFLSFGNDPGKNIDRLTSLCGEILGGDCALYNCLKRDELHSSSAWNTPKDFKMVDKAKGHICYDVIKRNSDEVVVIRNLPDTEYLKTDPNVELYNLQTYIGRAVKFGGAVLGSLCIVYQYDFVPSAEDVKIIELIASAIGVEENRKTTEEFSQLAHFSIDRMGDSVFWVGRDANIIYINETAQRFVEYSREELLKMNVRDLEVNFSPPWWEELWNQAKEKGSFTFESKVRKKSGETTPIETSVNYVEYKGKEYLCAFVRNITQRKKAEGALLKREYQLEILSRTSQHINAILAVPVVMRTLVTSAMELVGATAGTAGLLQNGKM